MSDDAFGPLEDAFFAAGDAYDSLKEDSASDQDVFVDDEHHPPLRLAPLRSRLEAALTAARARVVLVSRLLQLRVSVALSTCAEQAVYATAFRVIGARPMRARVHTFIPRLTRNPVLVRASLVVLAFTAATFPTAAVLAAAGAI
jgi:hypothetical protein